jgi:FAD/FMN-containing dehydrogenase
MLDFYQMSLSYHKIFLDLEKLIAGDILCDHKTLTKYSKDASLFTVRPEIVVYPKDKFDIQAVVKYVQKVKDENPDFDISITARAAGTDMSGGPLNNSIIIDTTKYMHKIFVKNFVRENMTIECEPGVYFRDLEKFLNKYNLMYPSYPASKDLCCVGGIVSNNSSGEKTLLYGSTKDWVEEVEVVLQDGTIHTFSQVSFDQLKDKKATYFENEIFKLISENKQLILNEKPKTSKNSSGYFLWDCVDWKNEIVNLAKLICGSQGTLCIITKVKLRLVPQNKYSQMLTVMLPDLKNLVPLVQVIQKYKPEAIETFDDHTFKIAMRFLPTIFWKLKGNIWKLGVSFLPEVWMAMTGGVPKLILMAEFTGNSQREADTKAGEARKNIQNFSYKSRVTKNQTDLEKYWLFRRESFNLLRSKMKGFRTAPFVEDTIVPVANTIEFVSELQEVMNKYKYLYTIAGHAGNGNFHIIPLMKLSSKEEVEIIKKTNQEVFSLVQKYGGSISAEHNDGLVRTPYLHFMFSDAMLDLFQQTKDIFDPLNIFNPGKKVGGSIDGNYKKIELQK